MAWQVEWLILWEMIVKMLTHIHMMVYTWWCWHICKGDEVGVDVDQLGDETEARRVRNSTGGVSTRRVWTVRRCHRRPIQKRQGLIEWTGCWSRGDRTLESYVRLVAAVQPGHSVLTNKSVRFVRLLQTSVPRNQQPIGVLENRKPLSSVSVESVRFLGSTELTEAEV